MKAAGTYEEPGGQGQPIPGLPAVYMFAGRPEPCHVMAWTRNGCPVVRFGDGRLCVVEVDRIRLPQPPPRRTVA
jgi:hypothetical protein